MTGDLPYRDASEAALQPMNEAEFAARRRRQGVRVLYRHGHYWEVMQPGFYQPVHQLSRLALSEIRAPSYLRWGLRATVRDQDRASANGAMPIHLLADISDYSLDSLDKKQRDHVRRALGVVKIVQLTSPELLKEQGYEVLVESLSRTKHRLIPAKEVYLADNNRFMAGVGSIVLGALLNGNLCAYLEAVAVNTTAHILEAYHTHEALHNHVPAALVYQFVQVCRQGGIIREVARGQHMPEVPGLEQAKAHMGFPVVQVPAVIRMHPWLERLVRQQQPHAYYRLTGHY